MTRSQRGEPPLETSPTPRGRANSVFLAAAVVLLPLMIFFVVTTRSVSSVLALAMDVSVLIRAFVERSRR